MCWEELWQVVEEVTVRHRSHLRNTEIKYKVCFTRWFSRMCIHNADLVPFNLFWKGRYYSREARLPRE